MSSFLKAHSKRNLNNVFCFILFLAVPRGLRDLSSPTRDGTQAPGSESAESLPLDRQEILNNVFND